MEWITPLLVALIGGPVMWVLSRLDRTNREQHDEISKKVDRINDNVGELRKDLHDHVTWHLSEEYDVRKELRKQRREQRRKDHEDLYQVLNQIDENDIK